MFVQVTREHARRFFAGAVAHAGFLKFGETARRHDCGVIAIVSDFVLVNGLRRPLSVTLALGAVLAGLIVRVAAILHTALAGEVDDGVVVEDFVDRVCVRGLALSGDGPLRRRVFEDIVVDVGLRTWRVSQSRMTAAVDLPFWSRG